MYQFNFDESSWIFAREKCLAQNADLVSIGDQEELVTPSPWSWTRQGNVEVP